MQLYETQKYRVINVVKVVKKDKKSHQKYYQMFLQAINIYYLQNLYSKDFHQVVLTITSKCEKATFYKCKNEGSHLKVEKDKVVTNKKYCPVLHLQNPLFAWKYFKVIKDDV